MIRTQTMEKQISPQNECGKSQRPERNGPGLFHQTPQGGRVTDSLWKSQEVLGPGSSTVVSEGSDASHWGWSVSSPTWARGQQAQLLRDFGMQRGLGPSGTVTLLGHKMALRACAGDRWWPRRPLEICLGRPGPALLAQEEGHSREPWAQGSCSGGGYREGAAF